MKNPFDSLEKKLNIANIFLLDLKKLHSDTRSQIEDINKKISSLNGEAGKTITLERKVTEKEAANG